MIYKLNIHHRNIALEKDQDGNIVTTPSPGHFFVSLAKGSKTTYFGKYSKGDGISKLLFGKGQIKSKDEKVTVNLLSKIEKETGIKYLNTKTIYISQDQYNKALEYAVSKSEGKISEDNYIIGLDDCTNFVQSVYHTTGMPLYFTSMYNKEELVDLNSQAADNVLRKYGSKDTFNSFFEDIADHNKQSLAASLNIPEDIIVLSASYVAHMQASDDTRLKFSITNIDNLVQQITDTQESHKTAEQKYLKTLDDLDISKMNLEKTDTASASSSNKTLNYILQLEEMLNSVTQKLQTKLNAIFSQFNDKLTNELKQCEQGIENYSAEFPSKEQSLQQQLDAENEQARAMKTSELNAEITQVVNCYNAILTSGGQPTPINTAPIKAKKQQEYQAIVKQKAAYYRSLGKEFEEQSLAKVKFNIDKKYQLLQQKGQVKVIQEKYKEKVQEFKDDKVKMLYNIKESSDFSNDNNIKLYIESIEQEAEIFLQGVTSELGL